MSEDTSFRDLIRRVRAGDKQAETELVRSYEPMIRLVVRRRLTDPELRRLFESMDICQSILISFFEHVRLGQYELDTAEQLLKLLSTMARHKLMSYARKYRAARRNPRRVRKRSLDEEDAVDHGPSPSEVVAHQELLQEFRQRLSEEERRLVDLRASGHSWMAIAAAVGGNADTLRMQLTRAIARVARELGAEEGPL